MSTQSYLGSVDSIGIGTEAFLALESIPKKKTRWQLLHAVITFICLVLGVSIAVIAGPTSAFAKGGSANWAAEYVQQRVYERTMRALGEEPDPDFVHYIVNGINAFPTDNPFQVALLIADRADNRDAQFCGGTLIAKNIVVTAAHCSDFLEADQVQVLTGTRRLDGSGTRRNVSQIYVHPNFDSEYLDYDVAVWKLASEVGGVAFATLASTDGPIGGNLLVTGWGVTVAESSIAALDLQRAQVPLVDRAVCNDVLQSETRLQVSESMLCAGYTGIGPDSCRGDSGGPLTRGAGNSVLTGIVSWGGYDCNGYGVYTRVSHPGVRSFIERVAAGREARVWVNRSLGTSFDLMAAPQSLATYWDGQRWLVGDFDGDGLDDLANLYGRDKPDGSQETRVWVHGSTGSNFELITSIDTLAGYWDSQRWLVGDFNGDGRDDLVNIYGRDKPDGHQETRVWVHASTGTGFEQQTSLQTLANFWEEQRWLVGDFNGDGRDDLVNIYGRDKSDGSQETRVWIHASTGTGFEYLTRIQTLAGYWEGQRWLVGNFNGDRYDDLVNIYGRDKPDGSQETRVWVHASNGSSFEYLTRLQTLAGYWDEQRWIVGDMNGDNWDDLINIYERPVSATISESRVWVHASLSSGFEYLTRLQTVRNWYSRNGDWQNQHWYMGDFNRDARQDVVNIYGRRL